MNSFLTRYMRIVAEAIGANYDDNYDVDRFGQPSLERVNWKAKARNALERAGITTSGAKALTSIEAKRIVTKGLDFVEPYLANLEWLHANLADEESRSTLVNVTAYRALGHRKIKLSINKPGYWATRAKAAQLPRQGEEIDVGFLGWKLRVVDLSAFGYPIKLFANQGANVTTFVHQQYRCDTPEGVIECREGDYAIDAGGCYGDTALYFAHKAGPQGHVASFEFLPVNVSVFRRNMELNPDLASRIRLYENPVYSVSGQELFVISDGPGTRVVPETSDPHAGRVQTLKIDELVAGGDFPRVDFVKMDIEGAELEALKGSEEILRQFRPKLAITVYHDFKDFWAIPRYIDSLGLGYRFYLRHFTIHAEETVLFAAAD